MLPTVFRKDNKHTRSRDPLPDWRKPPMSVTVGHNASSHAGNNRSERRFQFVQSNAFLEWEQRKKNYGETSVAICELMRLQGLEGVKQQFLDIKSKVDICRKQGRSLNDQRYSAVFQGNPGTGKFVFP